MDHKEKYEQALKTAKMYYEQNKDFGADFLPIIFPELRESEDERIRKFLITIVNNLCAPNFKDVERKDVLAYLEKQKDASKAIEAVDRIDKYIDEHLANAHDMKDSNPDKKYYRGWDDALGKMAGILQDVYSDEKQKKQKPEERFAEAREKYQVEWNEEDEEKLKAICTYLRDYSRLAKLDNKLRFNEYCDFLKSLRPQPKQEWSEEDENVFNDILLDMADRREMFKSKGETTFAENTQKKIEWLDRLPWRFELQPKQEWSEEDEKMRNLIVAIFEVNHPDDFFKANELGTTDMRGVHTEEIIAWLKSLRPSWEPSEEQMEVDLDKEIEEYWVATGWSKKITLGKFKVIARYFYGLGQLNSK